MKAHARDRMEISDLIVDFDPATLERREVRADHVITTFKREGNRRAVRIVKSLPTVDGRLDPRAVDRLLVRVHTERQRLSEEFEQGRRIAGVLTPILEVLRRTNPDQQVSLIDIGCANGYAIRYLAAKKALLGDIRLIGVDFNPALIAEARQLAASENLDVEFRVANALTMAEPGAVLMSTGVLHHFRGDSLAVFFRQHDDSQASAFVHFDLQPAFVSTLGTWLLHQARTELPLTRHDGTLSARRAYSLRELQQVASESTTRFQVGVYRAKFGPFPCTIPAFVGTDPAIFPAVAKALRLDVKSS